MAESKNSASLSRRIGSTNFKVKIHFSDTEKETMQDKIYRLIQHDAMTNGAPCGIIELPQVSRQSERSAS